MSKQNFEFQAEVGKILNIVANSLYSDKEIFIREYISNASDACDKLRYLSNTKEKLLKDDPNFSVSINVDKKSNLISISDNGIGMSEDEVIENIGTIARSGTASFLENITGDEKKDSNLIGQFGVGFYSVFMVADKVQVISKSALNDKDEGTFWESTGEDKYKIKSVDKINNGTEIHIFLNDDNTDFADIGRVRFLLEKYSQYINFPLYISDGKETNERVNEAEALWLKSKRSIKDVEYKEFYKFISFDQDDPLLWIHNKVEGKNEYTNLVYIPSKPPFDLWNRESPRGLKLYIQRVFIMDDASNFLPLYLRFLRGVIDTNDLPLNVSREILQSNPLVDTIKKSITKTTLDSLKKLKDDSYEEYLEFWKEFGLVLKEGPAEDIENRELIESLMLFNSSNLSDSSKYTSLDSYVENMNESDDKIYFCVADTFEAATNSPHIEKLKSKNIEVLLLTDRIDEWLMTSIFEYKGKQLVNVSKESVSKNDDDNKLNEKDSELTKKIKKYLNDRVSDVVISDRLIDSATCLILPQSEPGAQLRKILEASGQSFGTTKPIFEVNKNHKLLKKLKDLKGKQFNSFVDFLYDYALIAEGGSPKDPAKYLRQLDKYLS